jgi:hypothetical protein
MNCHRKWKELQNDEIFAIWKEYLRSEGLAGNDLLHFDPIRSKPMRLSPIEIIKLVEELLDRLEIKETKENLEDYHDRKEMDSGCNKAQRRLEGNSGCEKRRENSCFETKEGRA